MPSVHWPRGGSNSERIYNCPRSVLVAAMYPEDRSSEAAIDGTHSHTLLETCLTEQVWEASSFVGRTLSDHDGEFVVDAERAARVQQALDYVSMRLGELVDAGHVPILKVEEFVDAGAKHGVDRWGGSADVTIDWGEGIEIIDYKDGGRPVSPQSKQLVTYIEGSRDDYHQHLMATIVQPKVYDTPQSFLYTKGTFEEALAPLVDAMRASMGDDPPVKAGEHCTYCPGARMGRCEEWSRAGQEAINAMVLNPSPPGVQSAPVQPLTLPGVGEHTSDETLAAILDAEPVVTSIIKEAKEEALRRLGAGIEVPGYAVERPAGRRQYVPDAEAKLKKLRLKQEVIYEKKLKTPRQLIDSPAFKSLPDEKKDKVLELIVQPEGAPKLTRVSSITHSKPDHKNLFAQVVNPKPLNFFEEEN